MLQDQINLNIWVARSYMRRLQEAPDDFELCRRVIYYYTCANFAAYKYANISTRTCLLSLSLLLSLLSLSPSPPPQLFSSIAFLFLGSIDIAEIELGIDYAESHFISRAVPAYLITQRLAFAEVRSASDPNKILEAFETVEQMALYMLNYYNCDYTSRLFNAATMQTILGIQKKFPTLPLLDRTLNLLPKIADAALTNSQGLYNKQQLYSILLP